MKLKELLALLKNGWFRVVDRDTGLRTENLLSLVDDGSSQLRTLRGKKVKSIRLCGKSLMEIEVAVEE